MTIANEPAIPTIEQQSNPNRWSTVAGLTKRELFAAIALNGLCAGRTEYEDYGDSEHYAKIALQHADALINALNN